MMIWFEQIGLVLVLISTMGILASRNWRWIIGFLALQFISIFFLVMMEWTIAMASIKLVSGWMACVILGMAHSSKEGVLHEQISSWMQGRLFRLAAIGILIVVSYTGGLGLSAWLNLSLPLAWGAVLLISMGLFTLGVSSQHFRVVVGLLTALSGFEIIYAAVERSALVAALQALIILGLALSGAYFLSSGEEHP